MEKTISMFVYGLLRPGQPLYHVLEPRVLSKTENALVRGFSMYAGSCPIAVRGMPADIIKGTLLVLANDMAMIREVDSIESSYDRERVTVETDEGAREAWMYIWLGEPWGQPVKGGDFVSWRRRQR